MPISGRSLCIPPGAAGLVEALAARERGDGRLWDEWMLYGHPLLRAAIFDWLGDRAVAERVTGSVLLKAFLAVTAGCVVRNEPAWLARLARNALADEGRESRRGALGSPSRPLSLSLSLSL